MGPSARWPRCQRGAERRPTRRTTRTYPSPRRRRVGEGIRCNITGTTTNPSARSAAIDAMVALGSKPRRSTTPGGQRKNLRASRGAAVDRLLGHPRKSRGSLLLGLRSRPGRAFATERSLAPSTARCPTLWWVVGGYRGLLAVPLANGGVGERRAHLAVAALEGGAGGGWITHASCGSVWTTWGSRPQLFRAGPSWSTLRAEPPAGEH